MKILYIHQYFQVNAGGTRSYEFSKYLVKKDHDVTILTGRKMDKKIYEGIKIVSTNTNYDQNLSFIRRVYAFMHFMIKSILLGIKQRDIDIVFATSTPLTVGLAGVIVSKLLRKKLVFEVRDVWPDIPIELGFIKNKVLIKILKKIEKIIYNNSEHIIALSIGMKENIVKKGINPDKITVITNLSNNQLVETIDVNKQKILEKYPILENKFVCIHPGTMGFVNGLEHILELAKQYRDEDIVYLLVGEGNQKEKLIAIKNKNNLDNVIILDGMAKKEVLELILFSKVGIMSVNDYEILQDNSANKFFDFLAIGKPVILNYLGWQHEVLTANQAGKGFKYEDLEGYYSYLKDLKENKGLYEETSRNAKMLAVNYFDSIKLSEQLHQILLKVLR